VTASPGLGHLTAEKLARVATLRAELRRVEDRYGVTASDEITQLDRALRRRTAKIDVLSDRLDEILETLIHLEAERAGLLSGMELALTDHITRVHEHQGEVWSPWPVYAYRLWGVTASGLVGMVERWPTPAFEATCAKLPLNPDVPHTDDRCGEPRCGIYAAKRPDHLVPDAPAEGGWAIGLVALTGKVVEHESGYRAQQADVQAIVIHHDDRVLAAEEPHIVGLAFAATVAVTKLLGQPAAEWPIERSIATLTAAERRLQWTSDPSDA
jgi:hypothetical protein